MSEPVVAPGLLARPLLHAATGSFALLLGVLPREGAVACAVGGVLVGWVVFPLSGLDRRLRRPGEPFLGGLRTYPLAVLGLVLWLPPAEAAAAWAVLACGDAAAAVVGRALPSPAVFSHPRATWAGSAAYLVVGCTAAVIFGSAVGWLGRTYGIVYVGAVPSIARCVVAALAGALAELLPIPPDDNLPSAAAAGLVLRATRSLM